MRAICPSRAYCPTVAAIGMGQPVPAGAHSDLAAGSGSSGAARGVFVFGERAVFWRGRATTAGATDLPGRKDAGERAGGVSETRAGVDPYAGLPAGGKAF